MTYGSKLPRQITRKQSVSAAASTARAILRQRNSERAARAARIAKQIEERAQPAE